MKVDGSRFPVEPEQSRRLLDGFLAAIAAGDKEALMSMFVDDATFTSDGGGKVSAVMNTLVGPDRIARLLLGIEEKWGPLLENRRATINGAPGILTYAEGRVYSATAFEIVDGRIHRVHRVLNPDKLRFAQPGVIA